MRRSLLGRCWLALMVTSMGSLPVLCGPCCSWQTHDDRQAFLEAALSNPWAATPGSPAYPSSFLAGTISRSANPDTDNDGNPDNPILQSVLNSAFNTVATIIQSQIDVKNPWGWADLGRPR